MVFGSLTDSSFTYRAFLSYSHADKAWADWLYKALETYRVPARLVGMHTPMGVVPRRLTPVFRDSEELASATDLGRTVDAALARSAALVVICSPRAAKSRWVDAEVRAFKRMGRGERLFCVIVEGEPNASNWPGHEDQECFCPGLRYVIDEFGDLTGQRTEPVAADARVGKEGKSIAGLKIIAGLLGVGFDALAQREAHRRRRRMLIITAASVAGMAITSVLALLAYNARNEARQRQDQTEAVLNYMLGDLYAKLQGMGRLDVLASVPDKALALFAESKPGSLSDRELTQQSQALVQIGQIRYQQGQYEKAMEAFRHAEQQSSELTRRHPDNGQFLYDRAQAEYWIGYVYWQQRNLVEANSWLTRYRDSTLALLAIDPGNKNWQLETTYGEHNLGVLALERSNLDAARNAFRSELATQQRLLDEQPGEPQLTADVADTVSWLAKVATRRGDLAEAQRLSREQARQTGDLRSLYPDDYRWLAAFAVAQNLLAESLSLTGDNTESLRTLQNAHAAYRALTEHDPANVPWQVGRANVEIGLAKHALAANRLDEAAKLASGAIARLQALTPAAQTSDRMVPQVLGLGWRVRARIALQQGDFPAAMAAAEKALGEARSAMPKGDVDDDSLANEADALLVLGTVQQAQAPDVSPPAWPQARASLAARAPGSRYWHLLDPWVRLCLLTGNADCARTALERLNASGYVPLQPWPVSPDQPMSVANQGSQHEN